MFHTKRVWQISTEYNRRALARGMTEYTMVCCQGFRLPLPGPQAGSLLFLNDATGPDGAQEYAVVRLTAAQDGRLCLGLGQRQGERCIKVRGQQVESLTASWMTEESMLEWIMDAARAPDDLTPHYGDVDVVADIEPDHVCGACA